jgi:membrane protein required for colicin V production
MQELTLFDMVILGITLVLALKGLMTGIIKQIFGIVGIIGAIFVASRMSKDIGDMISPFLALENEATIKLIGFIVALIGFWFIVYLLGTVISKIFSASGLGLFDRIFGFIFGAAKIFLIFSVIVYASYQIDSFKKAIDNKTAGSIVMPHLLSVGSYIIKIDTSKIADNINNTVDAVIETTKDVTAEDTSKSMEETKEDIQEGISTTVEDVKEGIQDSVIKTIEEKLNGETKEENK